MVLGARTVLYVFEKLSSHRIDLAGNEERGVTDFDPMENNEYSSSLHIRNKIHDNILKKRVQRQIIKDDPCFGHGLSQGQFPVSMGPSGSCDSETLASASLKDVPRESNYALNENGHSLRSTNRRLEGYLNDQNEKFRELLAQNANSMEDGSTIIPQEIYAPSLEPSGSSSTVVPDAEGYISGTLGRLDAQSTDKEKVLRNYVKGLSYENKVLLFDLLEEDLLDMQEKDISKAGSSGSHFTHSEPQFLDGIQSLALVSVNVMFAFIRIMLPIAVVLFNKFSKNQLFFFNIRNTKHAINVSVRILRNLELALHSQSDEVLGRNISKEHLQTLDTNYEVSQEVSKSHKDDITNPFLRAPLMSIPEISMGSVLSGLLSICKPTTYFSALRYSLSRKSGSTKTEHKHRHNVVTEGQASRPKPILSDSGVYKLDAATSNAAQDMSHSLKSRASSLLAAAEQFVRELN
ncbi:Piso0_005685 [Millerozyma farinosa CBS 7064]|uniref:Piso0_005685 protein n=1 Tax=Pichia sorbitophila (strain ATCC MYA-4447 / BCRC 22081 / CBS 7064 / NBRC 10061 / NRRL Y-12695) TaxID=559304 RepID=G8XZN6_PICSO|nr:Piso0_005685 [Millerozyma farinosa CBS 7064]